MSQLNCHGCGQPGHIRSQCPDRAKVIEDFPRAENHAEHMHRIDQLVQLWGDGKISTEEKRGAISAENLSFYGQGACRELMPGEFWPPEQRPRGGESPAPPRPGRPDQAEINARGMRKCLVMTGQAEPRTGEEEGWAALGSALAEGAAAERGEARAAWPGTDGHRPRRSETDLREMARAQAAEYRAERERAAPASGVSCQP